MLSRNRTFKADIVGGKIVWLTPMTISCAEEVEELQEFVEFLRNEIRQRVVEERIEEECLNY